MGFLSGGNSSNDVKNITETNNINLQDVRGTTIAGVKNATINLSDQGAIEKAFNATNEALTFAQKSSESALDFAFNAGRPDAANTKTMLYVGGAVAAAVVLSTYKGKRK